MRLGSIFLLVGTFLVVGPVFAQQPAGNNAQKSPSAEMGTNAQTSVSTPPADGGAMSTAPESADPKAPSTAAGTNADQSKDYTRDPVKSK
jgi:hypothetical protein